MRFEWHGCDCVFAGQTGGAWTRCEFLTVNVEPWYFQKDHFLLNLALTCFQQWAAFWPVCGFVPRVSRVWWERKVTEGTEETRLVENTDRVFFSTSLNHFQHFLFSNDLIVVILRDKFMNVCVCRLFSACPGWQGSGGKERSKGPEGRAGSSRPGPALSCGMSPRHTHTPTYTHTQCNTTQLI